MQEIKTAIGIDHGFGNMKTRHTVFRSSVRGYLNQQPESLKRVVKYKDNYYVVGGERVEVKESKVSDDDYYILTLASLAEELKYRHMQKATIVIGAGLPLKRIGAEKEEFKKYLFESRNLNFEYEGVSYTIFIKEIEIYPQGYMAILPWVNEIPMPCLALEWGSWTIEVIYLEDKIPVLSRCTSIPYGTIRCIAEINKELMRLYGKQAEEKTIESIMIGKPVMISAKYRDVIERGIKSYVRKIMDSLIEYGFYLDMTPVIHLGGGATIVKNFYQYDESMTRIIEGIHINAAAFEQMVQRKFGMDYAYTDS